MMTLQEEVGSWSNAFKTGMSEGKASSCRQLKDAYRPPLGHEGELLLPLAKEKEGIAASPTGRCCDRHFQNFVKGQELL
jgi:hypothetical protein